MGARGIDPLARGRPTEVMPVFKKLIVGIDFSEIGERAARQAAALGVALGAEVVLVHVIAPGAAYNDPAGFITQVRPAIEEQLKEMATRLKSQSGARVEWGIVDGRPAEEIATFAERWGGDLIVCGTAGRTGIPRALVGSVADRLVRISKVPVLVVGPEMG